MNTCVNCKNWALKNSPLKAHGYGNCQADTNPATRTARTYSSQNVCRIGKFIPAEARTVAAREKAMAVVL